MGRFYKAFWGGCFRDFGVYTSVASDSQTPVKKAGNMRSFAVLVGLVWALPVGAQGCTSVHATVLIYSHGVSGTVVATGHRYGYILTCAHGWCDISKTGALRYNPKYARKEIQFKLAFPLPGPIIEVDAEVIRLDIAKDLCLIKVNFGPFPYVAKIAPAGFMPGKCVSCGFDGSKLPAVYEATRIYGHRGGDLLTMEKPKLGRSGGGLIDVRTGYTVGVVSGFNKRHGLYTGHSSILHFMSGVRMVPVAGQPSYRHMMQTPRCGHCLPAPLQGRRFPR